MITLTYNAKSGVEEGTIKLVPGVSSYARDISWDCQITSLESIQQWAPPCHYLQAYADPQLLEKENRARE